MKDIGRILLAIWLILTGLMQFIDLSFRYHGVVMGILAIVAGVFLAIRR